MLVQHERTGLQERALGALTRRQVDLGTWLEKRANPEEGSTTVEYAIGAIATAGFAGLLIAVLKSGGVKAMINSIIQSALSL